MRFLKKYNKSGLLKELMKDIAYVHAYTRMRNKKVVRVKGYTRKITW